MSDAPCTATPAAHPSALTTGGLASLADCRWDLLVVGAGPAGAAAACRAAVLGLRTLLVDRACFPRAKVCGGCLSPLGLAAVDSLGLGAAVRHHAVPLRCLDLTARNRSARLPLHAGVAISRESLDTLLIRHAARSGASVLESTVASLDANQPSHARVLLRQGGDEARVQATRVLVADGLSGSFLPKDPTWTPTIAARSRIGLGARLSGRSDSGPDAVSPARGIVSMHCARNGYVGMVRLNDGSIDLAAAIDPEALRRAGSPAHAINAILREADARAELIPTDTIFRGTGLLTRRRTAEHDAVLVAGDAASYVEPFTGEGMSWALTSGLAAAELVASSAAPGVWARQCGTLLSGRQRGCRIVSLALRWPHLVALGAGTLTIWPSIAPLVRRAFAGPWGTRPVMIPGGATP